ncbi:hypothetical protein [Nocardioides terrisoli]|uniref:hypothetical protein n=1 Tax=Nocardioides terrisoli TaxID=3388267 RepID=UPI00287B9565|nr:hypothetical protein [Nocardioides marmorisolisilvae]
MSDIIVGSVGVRLVPSAEGFTAKAKALTKGLTADVRAELDDKDAKARLAEMSRPRDAKVEANADTAKADAELDRAARTRTAKINTQVSGLDRVGSLLGDTKGFSGLTTGILALGPALVPVAAATAGLTAALGAPLVAGGGGLTLFGFLAGAGVKQTDKVAKQIAALKAQANTLTSPAARKAALAQAAALEKSLTGPQKALVSTEQAFAAALKPIVTSKAVLGPVTQALGLAADILPHLNPLLKATSGALSDLLDEADRAVKGGGLDTAVADLSKIAGPTIRTAGDILGNVAKGFVGIGSAFAPVGKDVGRSLDHWSKGFAHIGQSKDLKDFVGYVRREGPVVAHTLGDVAKATGHIVHALAPIGDVGLKAIDGLAKGISKIPTKTLTIAAGSLAGIALTLKGISLAKGGIGALSKLGGLVGIGKGGNPLTGGIASKASPVPVFVVNEGFGGVPGGGPGGSRVPGVPVPNISGGTPKSPTFGGFPDKFFLGEGSAATALKGLQGGGLLAGLIKGIGVTAFAGMPNEHTLPVASDNAQVMANIAREKAVKLTQKQAAAQAGLNRLLLSPALPDYGKRLASLPKAVQTKIATPGAVQSLSDVTSLAKQYNLTPKQVATIVALTNVSASKAQIADLARMYNLTPKQIRTIVGISGISGALSSIAAIKSQLASIPRSVRTDYYVNQVNALNKRSQAHATGGLIVGPGTGTSDSILARLSNREFVVNARATSRNLALLQKINAGAPGFASGGPVGKNPLTRSEFRSAASAFNLTEDLGIKALRKEFHKFAVTIHKDGGHLGKSFDDLRRHAVKNSKAYDDISAKFDLVSSRLQAARQTQSQARSTAAGSFAHDLFSGSLADFRTQAEADRNDAKRMRAAIRAAKGKGLSGALGAQLTGSGNLALAQQFAHESRSQIASLESLFGQRSKADNRLGAVAASFSDPLIKELRHQREADRDEMRRLRKVLEHLEERVQEGARKGIADRNQGAGNRKRTR